MLISVGFARVYKNTLDNVLFACLVSKPWKVKTEMDTFNFLKATVFFLSEIFLVYNMLDFCML